MAASEQNPNIPPMNDYKNMSRPELLRLANKMLKEISLFLQDKKNRSESRAKFHISEAMHILKREADRNG